MSIQYTHPGKLLVDTLQRIYDYGMTTTSGGNISIKDEEGNIWITPSGIDKGTLTPADIMKVTPSGDAVGCHTPSCELPFHRAVYQCRPEARVVLHAHSPALVAFSLVGASPDAAWLPGAEKICGKIAFSRYDIPGSLSLGKIIAAEFAAGADCVMMENHGAVVCGRTISEAFTRFETLDFLARIQIQASGLDGAPVLPAAECCKNAPVWENFVATYASPDECALRDSIVRFAARLYRQRLVYTGALTISARIKDDDFLVTPKEIDPLAFGPGDSVRIKEGKCESGKQPACIAALCREIYRRFDWAGAMIFTKSPNLMAFSCTASTLDSRMIPESYIQLRDMPQIKFADFAADPLTAVGKITPATPVVIVENLGVIAVGKNLTQAFDRLEVCDFTANCILLARRIGKVRPINQAQVDEIIDAFKLPR
ncbi:MAG: class II aldolase/adducin family protein [Victivallaceae bacterium]|nr:class II aldolase/adducin family protein [Victivallaceae bacterium]